jgi:hypothetical protein
MGLLYLYLYELTSVCIMQSGKAYSSFKLAYILTCFRNTVSVKIRVAAFEILTLVHSKFDFYSLKLMNCTVFLSKYTLLKCFKFNPLNAELKIPSAIC